MVLGFKPEFKNKILHGSKIHTIRRDKSNRWWAGNEIQFATGVRTKHYNEFMKGKCTGWQQIEIGIIPEKNAVYVEVDFKLLNSDKIDILAKNDGFNNRKDFFDFFTKTYGENKFEGKLVHWTDFRY